MGILEILIAVILGLLGTTGWYRHKAKSEKAEVERVQRQVEVVQERAQQAEKEVIVAKILANTRDDIVEKYIEKGKTDAADIAEGRRDQLDNTGRSGVRRPAGTKPRT